MIIVIFLYKQETKQKSFTKNDKKTFRLTNFLTSIQFSDFFNVNQFKL